MNAGDAALAALHAHDGQFDKSGTVPYIFHPLAVSRAVAGLGEDFEVVALLHDVWEDTSYELTGLTLRQEQALRAITQNEGEGYFDYIRRCRKDFIARVVKVADLRHNLSEERLGRLEAKERAGLTKRYHKALTLIDGTDE